MTEVPSKMWKMLEYCRGCRNSVWFGHRTAGSTGDDTERTLLSRSKGGNGETVEVFHVKELGGVSSDGAGSFFAENNRGIRRNGAGVR